jgi:CheY-like chemotaxis protein
MDNLKVLLIDDDPDDRKLYSDIVLQSCHGRGSVHAVATMSEAIEAADQGASMSAFWT